jgi:hypothetical protein
VGDNKRYLLHELFFKQENETLNVASFYVSNTQNWGVSDTGYFMDSSNPTYIATIHSQFTKTLDSDNTLISQLTSILRFRA